MSAAAILDRERERIKERLSEIEDEISDLEREEERLESELRDLKKTRKENCPSCNSSCLLTECPGCGGPVLVCNNCTYEKMRDAQDTIESHYACRKVLVEAKGKAYQGWCFGEDELL